MCFGEGSRSRNSSSKGRDVQVMRVDSEMQNDGRPDCMTGAVDGWLGGGCVAECTTRRLKKEG